MEQAYPEVPEQRKGARVRVVLVGVGPEHPAADAPDQERHQDQAAADGSAVDDQLALQQGTRRVSGRSRDLGSAGAAAEGIWGKEGPSCAMGPGRGPQAGIIPSPCRE